MLRFYFTFSVLLMLVFIGCASISTEKSSSKDHSFLLTNDSVKYWKFLTKSEHSYPETEGGYAFYKNGDYHKYQYNYEGKRVIVDNLSDDVICPALKFHKKTNIIYLIDCGWTYKYKILNLTTDTLSLFQLTHYKYDTTGVSKFLSQESDSIFLVKSANQTTKLVNGKLIQ